jgi:hypothetical protein
MKLGGEFRHPEKDRTQFEARRMFLRAVEEMVPETLQDLWDEVMPVYWDVWSKTEPAPRKVKPGNPRGARKIEVRDRPPWIRNRFSKGEWEAVEGPLLTLRESLQRWAEKFNLREDWILDTALRTLFFWIHGKKERHREAIEEGAPEGAGDIEAAMALPGVFADPEYVFTPDRPPFEAEGWDPFVELEDHFRDRLEKTLEAYIKDRRTRDDSVPETPNRGFKRSRHGGPLRKHLEWLILYQVRKKSYQAIAEEVNVGNPGLTRRDQTGRGTVTRGVKAASELLDLSLRSPGRNQYG